MGLVSTLLPRAQLRAGGGSLEEVWRNDVGYSRKDGASAECGIGPAVHVELRGSDVLELLRQL